MDCITLLATDKALLASAGEIRRLHGEIIDAARTTLDKALRIGELLADVKESLPHGQFGPWCAAHLPFTDRTARNYLRLHRERDRLKTETVSDLGEAYRLIAGTAPRSPESVLHDANMGPHRPESWEPGAGQVRIGFATDGRVVVVESVAPGMTFVRYAIVGRDRRHIEYLRRPVNRHFLRYALGLDDIDPDAVDWLDPLPATAANNPCADLIDDWAYDAGAQS